MSRPGGFRAGADPRRNVTSGPGPTAQSIATAIRRTVGVDAQCICDQVRALAAGGDPAAVVAAAFLLGAIASLRRRDIAEENAVEENSGR